MSTNLKTDVRARMTRTGEKYTEARRAILTERDAPRAAQPAVEKVVIHTTGNGAPLFDENCEATTKRGRQCRNPFIYGQIWPGGHPEVTLPDDADVRMLAQRRCAVHVDHDRPAEVVMVFDDVVPSRFTGPYPKPVWQDPRSLELIRSATAGRDRADALAVYLTLTEQSGTTASGVKRQTGLSTEQIDRAMDTLATIGLVKDGTIVG